MGQPRKPRIFISYRRGDASPYANLLDESLSDHFGEDHVFRDIVDISPGKIFMKSIQQEINKCDVLLALIGKSWLTTTQKKLADGDEDLVRFEIATALERVPPIEVIPLLVDGAQIPKRLDLPADLQRLFEHNAKVLSDGGWRKNEKRELIELLEEAVRDPNQPAVRESKAPVEIKSLGISHSRLSLYGGSIAGFLAGLVVGIIYVLTAGVEPLRALVTAAYGFVVGVMFSGFINFGMREAGKLFNGSRLSRLIGSVLGGIAAGVISAILGGVAFAWLSGKSIEPELVTFAVIISNIFIAIGILSPQLRKGWDERLYTVVVLLVVTLIIGFFARWLLHEHEKFLTDLPWDRPFNTWVFLIGAGCGMIAGIQVGVTLFLCSRDEA